MRSRRIKAEQAFGPLLTRELGLAIVEKAEFLDERLVRFRCGAFPPTKSPTGARVLQAWQRSYSPNDADAFHTRLGWDGLDEPFVEAAWAETVGPPGDEAGAWTSWLEAFGHEAIVWERQLETGPPQELTLLKSDPARPFLELWLPFVRAARRRLEVITPERLNDAVVQALMRQWTGELTRVAELAAYAAYSEFVATDRDARGDTKYRDFVHGLLEKGLMPLFGAYPALARQTAVLAESWVRTTGELLERLQADRDAIAKTFGGGTDPGELVAVETGLSDKHHGGRRVFSLRFRSGLKLVYKPRDLRLERAYNELLHWAEKCGLEPSPKALRVLVRPGYGWVEHVEHRGPESEQAVRQYFRRAGAITCFSHLLRAKDLHMENLIATAAGPVLVDTEMLCQPMTAAPGDTDSPQEWLSRESCLETGILSLLHTAGDGRLHDLGGLKGCGDFVTPGKRRVWHGVGTDSLRLVEETERAPHANNRVFFGDRLQRPERFTTEMREGFEACYRFLSSRREELIAPGGPLSRFAACRTRVIFRPSVQYALLQYVLAQPRYQRVGWLRSVVIDSLNRDARGKKDPPRLWSLVAAERSALERLDIPRFELPTTATEVVLEEGDSLSGHFALSGFHAVTERARSLSEADLSWQLACLDASLSSSVDSRFGARLASSQTSPSDGASNLMDHACWIGDELLARARTEGGRLSWHHLDARGPSRSDDEPDRFQLYDGAVGIGLLFAALAATDGHPRWKTAAGEVTRTIGSALEREDVRDRLCEKSIGACEGIGSLVYGLAWMGRLLSESNSIELARRSAALLSPFRIRCDRRHDVMSGAAGALLALLTLHREDRDPSWLALASESGRHLLSAATMANDGTTSWASADGRHLAGFAHGAAGIAYALSRLYLHTGEDALLDTVRSAHGFERRLFSESAGNWPIVDESGNTAHSMIAWCHGAPGVGLARALSLDVIEDDAVLREINVAMSTTRQPQRQRSDHICCGNMGRSDALLTVGLRLERPELVAAAGGVARSVNEMARETGRFSLPSTEFAAQTFLPGFFRGLAGIGYQLARLAHPTKLPSIPGFEIDLRGATPERAQPARMATR